MGNVCQDSQVDYSSRIEQVVENQKKNVLVCDFEINLICKLKLLVGSYRYHQSDLLIVFSHLEDVQYSPQIKDYAQNYLQLIENAHLHKKGIINVHVNKGCPYKRFYLIILPHYNSQQSDIYYHEFQSAIKEILESCSQFTLQINQTSQIGKGVPNQTLISLFIKYLYTYNKPITINFISNRINHLNMVRYQMAKQGKYLPLIKYHDSLV